MTPYVTSWRNNNVECVCSILKHIIKILFYTSILMLSFIHYSILPCYFPLLLSLFLFFFIYFFHCLHIVYIYYMFLLLFHICIDHFPITSNFFFEEFYIVYFCVYMKYIQSNVIFLHLLFYFPLLFYL